MHAVYERIVIEGPRFVGLRLTPAALRNARLGSLLYNIAHNLGTAGLAVGFGLWLGVGWLAVAGCVLVAHIGMDRLLGYGLKYPTTFKDTHLQHV